MAPPVSGFLGDDPADDAPGDDAGIVGMVRVGADPVTGVNEG
jgi:hypothetical protein